MRENEETKGGSGSLSKAQARLVLTLNRGATVKSKHMGAGKKMLIYPGREYVCSATIISLHNRGFLEHHRQGINTSVYVLTPKAIDWIKKRS